MARYDRIASLPPPTRERTFPAWFVLRDLESNERDAELGRRTRLRFLALRPVRRMARRGIASVPPESFDRQLDGVREELGHLPARDPERARIARFLQRIRERTPLAVTTATLDLGQVVESAEHYHGAEEFYRTALELAEQNRLAPEQIVALRLLGRMLRKVARWDEADHAYRRAAELALDIDDRDQWARSLDGLGVLLRERGRPDEARAVYGEVLAYARAQNDEPLGAVALAGLCYTEIDAGDFERAIEHGWNAIRVARSEEQRGALLRGLGVAFAAVGLLDAAERCHRGIAERSGIVYLRVQAWLDLAALAVGAGRTDLARERLREAVGAANRHRLSALLARAEALLAELEHLGTEPAPEPEVPQPGATARRVAAEIEALGVALVPASG